MHDTHGTRSVWFGVMGDRSAAGRLVRTSTGSSMDLPCLMVQGKGCLVMMRAAVAM